MMRLKNFDAKQFLLEKGEFVGLYTAGGLAALMLLCGLFWPGYGFLGNGASANAGVLKKETESSWAKLRNATPPTDDGIDKDAAAKLLAEANLKPGDSDLFRTWTAF